MPLQIRFTVHERDLLLQLISTGAEIVKRLKHAMLQHNSITITVDEDELEILLGTVAAEAAKTKDPKREGELQALLHRLDDTLRIHLSA